MSNTLETSKGSQAVLWWDVKEEEAFMPPFHCGPGKQNFSEIKTQRE